MVMRMVPPWEEEKKNFIGLTVLSIHFYLEGQNRGLGLHIARAYKSVRGAVKLKEPRKGAGSGGRRTGI